MNTIEQFVIFLPLLWLATIYFRIMAGLPPILGFVWCLGRIIYSMGYMAAPEKRGPGFGISVLASLGLLILSVYGLIATWIAGTVLWTLLTLHDRVDLDQLLQQRREILELDHVGPVGRRMVGILVHFHEDRGDTRRHRGARQIGHHGAVAAGRSPCPPGCCTEWVASNTTGAPKPP